MAYACPQGHQSSTADFCDVCGAPIDATAPSAVIPPDPNAPTPPPAPNPPPSSLDLPDPNAPALTCPNCATENPADALFCEGCGYDFTTGQMPAAPAAAHTSSPPPGADWVAELWIDPEWFDHQDAPGGCATSGAPKVVPLRATTITVGRVSRSRNLSPDLDCSADGAVSHQHAQFTLDRDRWSVEDLGSTNGTFVGAPGEPLPDTPLTPRQRRELADDERVYLGAWTRIMIRRATDNEKTGTVT